MPLLRRIAQEHELILFHVALCDFSGLILDGQMRWWMDARNRTVSTETAFHLIRAPKERQLSRGVWSHALAGSDTS
jgi:hypothetical protein